MAYGNWVIYESARVLRFLLEFLTLSLTRKSSSGHGTLLKIVLACGNLVIYEIARALRFR